MEEFKNRRITLVYKNGVNTEYINLTPLPLKNPSLVDDKHATADL